MKKIDVHGHLGIWPFAVPPARGAERLLRLCERDDIRFVACSSALALAYDLAQGNAELAQAIRGHDALLGYVSADPRFIDASVAEMDRYLPRDDFVGVKIHPRLSQTPDNAPWMARLISEVASRAPVLLMHTVDQNAARQMGRYARQYPGLGIILAHAAHTDSDEAARVAAAHHNVYLDFCCEWPGAGKVRRALEICGPGKILFGTDMDLLDPAFTTGMFESADLSDAESRAIYWDNAAGLMGLG